MTLDATMNRDHSSARTTCVIWREERLQNIGVLGRVRLFNRVTFTLMAMVVTESGTSWIPVKQCPSGAQQLKSTARHKTEDKCEMWGSHGGEDVHVVLLSSKTVWTCRQIPTFRKKHNCFKLQYSALKMETVCSSEMLVSAYECTRCLNPEDQTSTTVMRTLIEL
jgi:hypothetical protein